VKITLYFDEDAQDDDLIQALDLRGVDVIRSWSAGMRERSDEEHLLWAAAHKRTLYSFNVRGYVTVKCQSGGDGNFAIQQPAFNKVRNRRAVVGASSAPRRTRMNAEIERSSICEEAVSGGCKLLNPVPIHRQSTLLGSFRQQIGDRLASGIPGGGCVHGACVI
jgi:hypothetical protein